MDEELIEELEEVIEEMPVAPVETSEQREARLKREDYERRLAAAVEERQDILRRNGVIGPDDTLTMDTEAAIRQRCCF